MTVAAMAVEAGPAAADLAGIDIAVLAGGLGTRLQGVLHGRPKVLAPVAGVPFLAHLLAQIRAQGGSRVVLCLGHRARPVLAYLRANPPVGLQVVAIVEPRPLGTAGAIAHALPSLRTDPVLVLNGDTYVGADFRQMLGDYRRRGLAASMLCVGVPSAARYGAVEVDAGGRVARFREKDPASAAAGLINAGVYLFGRAVLERIRALGEGSLEYDVLQRLPPASLGAWPVAAPFVDIGTPESLARAAAVVPALAPAAVGAGNAAEGR
jgi:mannose-1-phosphate guanylyltransferase